MLVVCDDNVMVTMRPENLAVTTEIRIVHCYPQACAFVDRYGPDAIAILHDLITHATHRQDELIVQAQQKAIDENPDHVFYNLNIDAGAMWARRLIDNMVAAEVPRTTPGLQAAE